MHIDHYEVVTDPNYGRNRKQSGVCGQSHGVLGYFSVTRYLEERNWEGKITMSMRRFSEIIHEFELNDIPLPGGLSTWTGGLNNSKASR